MLNTKEHLQNLRQRQISSPLSLIVIMTFTQSQKGFLRDLMDVFTNVSRNLKYLKGNLWKLKNKLFPKSRDLPTAMLHKCFKKFKISERKSVETKE